MIQRTRENEGDEEELVALHVRGIPISVRSQFKAICAAENITMHEAIQRFMENVLEGRRDLILDD